MDIIQLLIKVQEIEKLKRILLDESQLYLFDMLTKPIIRTGTDDIKFQIKEKSKLDKMKVKKCFADIMMKDHKTDVDRRILALLDEVALKSIH